MSRWGGERLARVGEHPRVQRAATGTRAVARAWQEDQLVDRAAGVAFWVALSTFPILIALAAGLGVLGTIAGADTADRAQESVLDLLTGVVGGGDLEAGLVGAVRDLFAAPSTGALTLGLVGALYTGSRGVAGVVRALDDVYGLAESRGWVATRLLGLAIALGSIATGTVLLAIVVLGPLLGGGPEVAGAVGLREFLAVVLDHLRGPVAFAFVVALAVTLFHVAPNHPSHPAVDHRRPWRGDLPGAVLTATGWITMSLGFGLYLRLAATGNQVLGVLGGGLVFLLWVYLLSAVLLLGGALNVVLDRHRSGAPAQPGGASRSSGSR
ncbi:N/A [soil metagenome]